MFYVLHHVVDVPAAAREIARVLRPGGRLLTAGSFTERLHPRTYHHYMPRAVLVRRASRAPVGRGPRVVAVRRWASRYLAGGEAGLVDARATRTRRVLDVRWLDACER